MKSKTTPILIAILIPVVSIVVALCLVYFKKQNLSAFEDFKYNEYIKAPQNLVDNKYTLNAELEMQMAVIPDEGKVVSVRNSDGEKFAVFIPNTITTNAQTRQRYQMNIRIGSKGEIIVESMQKY